MSISINDIYRPGKLEPTNRNKGPRHASPVKARSSLAAFLDRRRQTVVSVCERLVARHVSVEDLSPHLQRDIGLSDVNPLRRGDSEYFSRYNDEMLKR
ncbi:hypothetical protein [Rhizobium sp. BK251]|uniref:hypothetical protein n=1 Tax=Rhizobium sp. BK251 TaxID=2512125 RepID=UPI0010496D29|nr:hypothetical protein [Rhizobium sp. BK251]TCL74840.1 hypothetical protein EV286_102403 [Rhizobium sp. BK251]